MNSTTIKPTDEALYAFSAVDEELLASITGLAEVVERLCDSLRQKRREHPDQFFGHPVEALYDSLEAALDDFYSAKVESTSSAVPIDPGAI